MNRNTVTLPMPALPDGYEAYKRTQQFSEQTIPKGFLKDHATKQGTWGILHIEAGSLQYVITEPGYQAEYLLSPDNPGVIVAQQRHHISACGPVKFHVEFYSKVQ